MTYREMLKIVKSFSDKQLDQEVMLSEGSCPIMTIRTINGQTWLSRREPPLYFNEAGASVVEGKEVRL